MIATTTSPVLQRARAGCRYSFGRLWSEHERRVRAVVSRALPPGHVEDVVQDVAVAALCGIGAFRAECGFAAWLLSIARNRAATARDVLRRQRARIGDGARVEAVAAADADVAERIAQRTAQRDVRVLLQQVPRSYRRPLWLRFVNGCSAAEIADRLGTTRGTVRVALCRGLQRLRVAVVLPSLD